MRQTKGLHQKYCILLSSLGGKNPNKELDKRRYLVKCVFRASRGRLWMVRRGRNNGAKRSYFVGEERKEKEGDFERLSSPWKVVKFSLKFILVSKMFVTYLQGLCNKVWNI